MCVDEDIGQNVDLNRRGVVGWSAVCDCGIPDHTHLFFNTKYRQLTSRVNSYNADLRFRISTSECLGLQQDQLCVQGLHV